MKIKISSSKTAGISDINYFRRVNHSNIVNQLKPKIKLGFFIKWFWMYY